MKIKKSFNVLALVPARIGSKRIPHKNIKNLCGKPLIAWTIDAAKKSKYVDKIIVSTDDKEIARISKNYGAEIPFIRPYRISKDDSKSIDVVIHALSNLQKFDWLLFLQPTSPLRRKIDIDNIFKFCFKHQASSAVSVYKLNSHDLKKSNNPKLIYNIDKKFRLTSQNKSYFKNRF